MLLWLAQFFQQDAGWLRIVSYISFRAVAATLTALAIGLAAGPSVIRLLTRLKVGQAVRTDGPQTHLVKSGTPTMGGLLILIAIAIAMLLWCDLSNRFVWIVMVVTMGFGVIGWVDDYRKVVYKNPNGMSSREKYFWQSMIGMSAAVYLAFAVSGQSNYEVWHLFIEWVSSGFSMDLPPKADFIIPFFKTISYPLGVWGFIALTYFVIVGTSNAVNLTDGLDGLAGGVTLLVAAFFMIVAWAAGSTIAPVCGAIVGGLMAFLIFNSYPAKVFMGDTGSLALGGFVASAAFILKMPIFIVIVGFIYLWESISVMLQVGWFKITKRKYGEGRRLFKMAPFHHHLEKCGWKETKVVTLFYVATALLCLIGFLGCKYMFL